VRYAELIGGLFPRLSGGVRWGLERTEALLGSVGDPHQRFRSIHIGGTNGKGSVSATLASILQASGKRVGLYTSPHLCTFRERIQIDGGAVGEEAVIGAAERLWPEIEERGASFFEATTAIAFDIFAREGVEIAVVEVGLGGRLDSTNLIDPEVVVITNVGLDHLDLLGPDLETISREKAGIIKPGVPVITGALDPRAIAILGGYADRVGAPFYQFDRGGVNDLVLSEWGTTFTLQTDLWGELALRTPLLGHHQADNVGLALGALSLLDPAERPDPSQIEEGLALTRLPGRVEWERIDGLDWIFDVAHNREGLAALRKTLFDLPLPRPLRAVIGILKDKEWAVMVEYLLDFVDHLILTRPVSAPGDRAWDPWEVRTQFPSERVEVITELGSALAEASARGEREGGTTLVTGSFHTVGDALALLGRAPYGVDPALPPAIVGI